MKKYLYSFIILCIIVQFSFAQSTEITPGTVLPSMTTAQRTGVASPKNGTLVFDTNTQSYWYRQSGVWVELPKGGSTSNYWQLNGASGNELKNTNSGGLWSTNPIGLTYSSDNISNPPTSPVNGDGTRLMWIPNRSAFRVGTVDESSKSWDADSIGLFSFASGNTTKASGNYSTAMGAYTIASGSYSTAMGAYTKASKIASTAMGLSTTASGNYSTAMGAETKASGSYSTAMGENTNASGSYSTATGLYTTASGSYSTAMGTRTSTNGKNGSFVIGDYITATAASAGDILLADADDQFSARFEKGYRLYTDNDLSATTKYGVYLENRDNSWKSLSDSTKKERFLPYDPHRVLNSVAAMRIGTWNYKGDDRPEGRHWGVMAQDFYHHFGTDTHGTIGSDTLIASADFDGVSFAAIKALELRTRELQSENEKLKIENEKIRKEFAMLTTKDEDYTQLFASLKKEIDLLKNASSTTNIITKSED